MVYHGTTCYTMVWFRGTLFLPRYIRCIPWYIMVLPWYTMVLSLYYHVVCAACGCSRITSHSDNFGFIFGFIFSILRIFILYTSWRRRASECSSCFCATVLQFEYFGVLCRSGFNSFNICCALRRVRGCRVIRCLPTIDSGVCWPGESVTSSIDWGFAAVAAEPEPTVDVTARLPRR